MILNTGTISANISYLPDSEGNQDPVLYFEALRALLYSAGHGYLKILQNLHPVEKSAELDPPPSG